ncbi:MAG: TOBE domain-containing protein, partial [Pseudomonadota bacterium]
PTRPAAAPVPTTVTPMDAVPAATEPPPSTAPVPVAVARAVHNHQHLMCMDEPLSALDAPRRAAILPYLERVAAETQVPILYVTHDVSEAARLSDAMIVMDQGQIVGEGPVAHMLARGDMAPYLGVRGAGGMIETRVGDTVDGLTQLQFAGGMLWLANVDHPKGSTLRLRIAAQDVILAKTAPLGLSALNVLPAQITEIVTDTKGAHVALAIGQAQLLARVTSQSVDRLSLKQGQTIHAIIKATAVDPAAQG